MSWIKPLGRITALGGVTLLVSFAGTASAQPSNDSFPGATVITSVPFSTAEDTTQATLGPEDTAALQACGHPGGTFSNSVWFAYTAASDQRLRLDTSGSSYHVAGAVLTGTPAGFSSLSCFLSGTLFQASQGTTYYIDLAQYGPGSGGMLSLSLTVPPPSVSIRTPANGAHYTLDQRVDRTLQLPGGHGWSRDRLVCRVGSGWLGDRHQQARPAHVYRDRHQPGRPAHIADGELHDPSPQPVHRLACPGFRRRNVHVLDQGPRPRERGRARDRLE